MPTPIHHSGLVGNASRRRLLRCQILVKPIERLVPAFDRAEFLHPFQLFDRRENHAQGQRGLVAPLLEPRNHAEIRAGARDVVAVLVADASNTSARGTLITRLKTSSRSAVPLGSAMSFSFVVVLLRLKCLEIVFQAVETVAPELPIPLHAGCQASRGIDVALHSCYSCPTIFGAHPARAHYLIRIFM
jgi:hypothetical protein